VTRLPTGQPINTGWISGKCRKTYFSSPHSSDQLWDPPNLFSPSVQRPRLKIDHLHLVFRSRIYGAMSPLNMLSSGAQRNNITRCTVLWNSKFLYKVYNNSSLVQSKTFFFLQILISDVSALRLSLTTCQFWRHQTTECL